MLHVLLRYTQSLITQMAQTAVCNRHHSLEQQLCRWLLLSLDRLPSNELKMTQELIANMLGRASRGRNRGGGQIAEASASSATPRQDHRARPRKFEGLSCECYAVVRRETDRLLVSPLASEPPCA